MHEESSGWFDELDDEEILEAQRRLAESEGVFCEPASATSVAGALRDLKQGKIPAGSTVVCTLTGNGLKDPDAVLRGGLRGVLQVDAERGAVEKVLLERL